jgi:hypothetical protein
MATISDIVAGVAFVTLVAANVLVMLELPSPLATEQQSPLDRNSPGQWVLAGSTLLDLAERNDVQIPYGCR